MADLADERPSLAPIRTARSKSGCYHYEPTTAPPHSSISSPLSSLAHKTADHPSLSSQSPCSSSSSHVVFLHSSSSSSHKNHSLLAKCLAPRPSGHGFLGPQGIGGSPRQKAHVGSGHNFRSVQVGFQGSRRLGSGAVVGTPTHSGPLKPGFSNSSKGHLANMNAFTMIPATVVGKKKPPDYLSDDPTSPEVTCIGGVRKSKPSKSTWDALLNSSEKLCKKKKAIKKQIEHGYSASRNLDQELQLASIPRPLYSSEPASKLKNMVGFFKYVKGLHSPSYEQRKLKKEDLVINLSHFHATCGAEDCSIKERDKKHNVGNEILCICQAGQAGEEDSCNTMSKEEGMTDLNHADMPPAHPNYMLMMRNMSGRSKVFHNHDDNSVGHGRETRGSRPGDSAAKVISSSIGQCQMKWNKKQGFSLWKSKKLFFLTSRTS